MRKALFLALFLLITLPVLAQGEPPVIPYEYPVIDLSAITALLTNSISGLVLAAFGAAPVTVVIVNLIKNLRVFKQTPTPRLTLATAGTLYIAAIVASIVGYTIQLHSLLDFVATSAPALVSFIGTLFAAPALYEAAKARDVPLIGTPRTKDFYVPYGG